MHTLLLMIPQKTDFIFRPQAECAGLAVENKCLFACKLSKNDLEITDMIDMSQIQWPLHSRISAQECTFLHSAGINKMIK